MISLDGSVHCGAHSRAAAKQKWVLGPDAEESAPPGIPVSIIVRLAMKKRILSVVCVQFWPKIIAISSCLFLTNASTDQTGDSCSAASESPFSIVTGNGSPLPEGWYGKPWALQRAQQSAVGEWLLFIDADVELSPQANIKNARLLVIMS